MELAQILQRLWRLRIFVALGVVAAAVAAALIVTNVSLSPLEVHRKRSSTGAAETTFVVDTQRRAIETNQNDTASLVSRAQIFARMLNSGAVRAAAAGSLGVPASSIAVEGPYPDTPGQQSIAPAAQQRANQLLSKDSQLSVFVDTEQVSPTVTLFTQAPTGAMAVRLADAMIDALRREVRQTQRRARPAARKSVDDALRATARRQNRTISDAERRTATRVAFGGQSVIRRMGAPVGGNVADEVGTATAGATFVVVLVLWCLLLLLLSRAVTATRRR